MRVKDIMSTTVACCGPETSLPEVARMMVDNDCGEIPVVNASGAPIGVVTDRDITCRTIAEGRNPLVMVAGDCMTSPCVTVTPETDPRGMHPHAGEEQDPPRAGGGRDRGLLRDGGAGGHRP